MDAILPSAIKGSHLRQVAPEDFPDATKKERLIAVREVDGLR
jgi:hypothetical protein